MAIGIIRGIASVAAFVAAAAVMELVARLMHKYVMHGAGWCLHYDHHNKRRGIFEKNDLYFFFFAGLSFVLIFFGLRAGWYEMAAAGFGVALYGIGYVLFHDIMFHRRVKWLKLKPKTRYLKRIINAHRMHHATVMRGGAVSYSFLWAPKFYSPENQDEVNKKMAEIREMQLMIKRRQKERDEEYRARQALAAEAEEAIMRDTAPDDAR
jgi:beta-carotene 3-hydroxylase